MSGSRFVIALAYGLHLHAGAVAFSCGAVRIFPALYFGDSLCAAVGGV